MTTAGEGIRGTSELMAAAATCLHSRPSREVRTWKSGHVQVPLP